MTEWKKIEGFLVQNGIPDGYVVRLVDLSEQHFPKATRVEERGDGSIDLWFDMVYLKGFAKVSSLPVGRYRNLVQYKEALPVLMRLGTGGLC